MEAVIRYDSGRGYKPRHKEWGAINWPGTIWRYFWISALMFGLYCAAAGIVYATHPTRTTHYSSYDYLKAAGLDAKVHYHLRLGAAVAGGSTGTTKTTTSSDFFLIAGGTTTTSTGEVVPSSTVRMNFRHGDTNYILEIPYSKVRFHQQTSVKSWVKFTVWVYDNLDKRVQHTVGQDFWTFKRGHVDPRPVHIQETEEWQYNFEDMGLSGYLNKYLAWVDMYLTPAQYNAYLGSLQTATG